MESTVLNIGTVVFAVGLLAELLFGFDYGLTAPWWRSWIGVMFILNTASIFFAGSAIMLGRVLGAGYTGRPYVTLATFLLFTASSVMRYGVYLHERGKPVSPLPVGARPDTPPPDLRRLTRRQQRALRRAELRSLRTKKDPR